MKKALIICGLFSIAFITFCFIIGYKLPNGDHHKSWTFLSENKDPNYLFHPVFSSNKAIKLGTSKTSMLINASHIAVVDSNGNILRHFASSDVVLIDNFHNRLILGKPAADYATSKLLNYFSYNLNDHTETPIKLVEYSLVKTYNDFAKRNGANLNDTSSSEIEEYKVDTVLVLKYKTANQRDMVFFSKLHPVFSIGDDIINPLHVMYYTDDDGKFYNIAPLNNTATGSHGDFSESMDILYPTWEKVPDLNYYHTSSPNFHFADKSAIIANNFNFESGINFSPTGGKDGPMRMYFEQNYLNYYSIKLKDSTAYFKTYNKASDIDINDISAEFIQLNNPHSDSDTLAFLYDSELYQVYRRHPLGQKR